MLFKNLKLDAQNEYCAIKAVDNAKFLGAAEQYIHAIYLEDPGKMKIPIMRLLYTVKMIFNVSTYFNNSVRISSLLVKITNQIIISCKRWEAFQRKPGSSSTQVHNRWRPCHHLEPGEVKTLDCFKTLSFHLTRRRIMFKRLKLNYITKSNQKHADMEGRSF